MEFLNPEPHSGRVFRFLRHEAWANDLVSGRLWLSTLEICRGYENPQQGDSEEATEHYLSGTLVTEASERWQEHAASLKKWAGFDVSDAGPGNVVEDVHVVTRLRDAHVLCCTTSFDPARFEADFGPYCVEILHPDKLFAYVAGTLRNQGLIAAWRHGKVAYRERTHSGLEDAPGVLGFVKPPARFGWQQEYRMVWYPAARVPVKQQTVNVAYPDRMFKRLR